MTPRKNPRRGSRPGRSAVVMPTTASGSFPPKQPGFGNSGRREADPGRIQAIFQAAALAMLAQGRIRNAAEKAGAG